MATKLDSAATRLLTTITATEYHQSIADGCDNSISALLAVWKLILSREAALLSSKAELLLHAVAAAAAASACEEAQSLDV